jgi:predicted transcriptional regulator
MTQAALAKTIGSSQARVAKMEGGDPQASIESLVRALAAHGGKRRLKMVWYVEHGWRSSPRVRS